MAVVDLSISSDSIQGEDCLFAMRALWTQDKCH